MGGDRGESVRLFGEGRHQRSQSTEGQMRSSFVANFWKGPHPSCATEMRRPCSAFPECRVAKEAKVDILLYFFGVLGIESRPLHGAMSLVLVFLFSFIYLFRDRLRAGDVAQRQSAWPENRTSLSALGWTQSCSRTVSAFPSARVILGTTTPGYSRYLKP